MAAVDAGQIADRGVLDDELRGVIVLLEARLDVEELTPPLVVLQMFFQQSEVGTHSRTNPRGSRCRWNHHSVWRNRAQRRRASKWDENAIRTICVHSLSIKSTDRTSLEAMPRPNESGHAGELCPRVGFHQYDETGGASCRLLQSALYCGAVDQARQECRQVDAAIMLLVRRRRARVALHTLA